ncbi:MAG: ABC transporter ATP-binding protein [Actinomycetota bacterium]|nr:ABC transporter ATP-binding protein [Actinomycetota bacterium]
MPAILVENLHKTYRGRHGALIEAVRGVSLRVEPGEVFALLGPNGAGKTSTLEILEGLHDRDAGLVEVLGTDPRVGGSRLRERIGVVLQETAVEPYLTVTDALRRNAGYYPNPRPVGEVLELVGLEAKADAKVKTLSGGQQRRLDVGLGIVGRPELIFLDEPTTGFDPTARHGAWEMVRSLTGGGTTVVLTTHYMDEAQELADRVAIIAAGRIVAEGTPDDLDGRDTAAARVRFRLPAGVAIGDLPVSARPLGEVVEVAVPAGEQMRVLHLLTGWALERGVSLDSLSVVRPSLEDVYLRLTGSLSTAVPPQAAVEPGSGPPA